MKWVIMMLTITVSLACSAKNPDKFNTYFEGAMTVYSQFENPSKDESERFYAFVKSKWTETSCKNDCTEWGQVTAKEYVKRKNIQVKEKDNK
ncbi:lysis inhibition [Acinetobacter phage 133]|uniref:Uncharacterized protein rI n=1 Tax=Acinetobacter phage 133 TaxID=2919552 RepID=D9I654_9CAUD|nr:lysis inhibition [Acinetobacter phage 133]ADJ19435.1 hypothetical protein Acj133p120 [Acinetobacter phage 133]